METAVEIPIYDEQGNRTGRAARVPDPPPASWTCAEPGGGGAERLDLRTMRVCRRFGCGCIWEEELGYVRAPAGE